MAKRKVKIGGFRTPIWKACAVGQLRPAIECAYIHNGFVYMTDLHLVVKQSLYHVHNMCDEEIENLEGKMIHRDILKYLDKCRIVEFKEDYILAHNGTIISKINYSTNSGIFPQNIKEIISHKCGTVKQIGFNPRYLMTIYETFAGITPNVHLFFESTTKGIKVTNEDYPETHQTAILMPTLIHK